jgi:hypothetical protein
MNPTNPAIIDHLAPVAESFLLTTLPMAETPQLAAMIVDANAGSKTDLAAIAVDQKKLETDLAEKALKEASDEIASLKKRASEREGEAVELVIKQLL